MINKILSGIVSFAETFEGFPLRPYQRMAIQRATRGLIMGSGGTLTNLWSRKGGKSETIKALILSCMSLLPALGNIKEVVTSYPHLATFKKGLSVAIAGPKMGTASLSFKRIRRQAKSQQFKRILSDLGLDVVTSNSIEFELSNGSLAQAFSGSETASSEGPDAHLLYIDEAQLLSPFSIYKILRPFVASTNGLIVETGTPGRKKCPFLSDIRLNLLKHPDCHLAVPYTDVIPFSPSFKQFIDAELERLPGGTENIYFKMNYLLEWILSAGHFVDPDLFLTLSTGYRGIHKRFDYVFGGIDWGKAGSATTVTIEGRSGEIYSVIDLLRLQGSYDEQFKSLVPFLKSYFSKGMLKVASETNSIGDPNTERLQRIFGKAKIEGFFTSPPRKDKIFSVLQNDIDGRRFTYFQDNSTEAMTFEREFLDAEQEVKGNLLAVHKPPGEGNSDDFLIATAEAHSLFPIRNVGSASSSRSSGHKRKSISATSGY